MSNTEKTPGMNGQNPSQVMEKYNLALKVEERYQKMLNQMMEGFQIIDFSWRYIFVNDAVVEQSRTTREKLTNQIIWDCFPQLIGSELQHYMKLCMELRERQQFENRMVYQDGSVSWFRLSIQPVPEGICVLSIEVTALKNAEDDLKRLNDILEQKVKIRTALLTEKTNELLDSINYAQRIQASFLPAPSKLRTYFEDSFIILRPKDIVSGDFYWVKPVDNRIVIVTADCTGHGVPGALLSIIGASALNEIVVDGFDIRMVLSQLNARIKSAFKEAKSNDTPHDGMDIALCTYDPQTRLLEFTGANRPLWLFRNDRSELEEYCPTRVSIGGYTTDDQLFVTHRITTKPGDSFYLSSDGFADQDGGERGKKLKTKNFKMLLSSLQGLTMKDQQNYLEGFADRWKNDRQQLDDILVLGIRTS